MRIAPELIDPDADKVVRRLSRNGFQAYLVGGCVRDLLLDRTPKDFDVATSATPREIKQLFRNCRIIGRRFRLAHIFFGGKIIETSTFRANPRQGAGEDDGELLIRHDNVFGSDTEDAHRRDFRINGLFYDVEEETVIDYVGGLNDLESRVVGTIGEPGIRFQEDPVRMMRAIKFAARLRFNIEPRSYAAICAHKLELQKCAQPRVLEEFFRLLRGGAAARSMELFARSGLAGVLSETLAQLITVSLPDDSADQPPLDTSTDDEDDWSAVWEDTNPGLRDTHDASGDLKDQDTHELLDGHEQQEQQDTHGGGEARQQRDTHAGREARQQRDTHAGGEARQQRDTHGGGEARRQQDTHAGGEARQDQQDQDTHPAPDSGMLMRLLADVDLAVAAQDPMSSSLLVATFVAPSLHRELVSGTLRPLELNNLIVEILQPLTTELGIARRDSERARQILLAQRRLAPNRKRRGKPMTLVRRDYFADSLKLYEMCARATGGDTSELEYWHRLRGQGADDDDNRTKKRRRRRRGGRRRRRADTGADLELAEHDNSDA